MEQFKTTLVNAKLKVQHIGVSRALILGLRLKSSFKKENHLLTEREDKSRTLLYHAKSIPIYTSNLDYSITYLLNWWATGTSIRVRVRAALFSGITIIGDSTLNWYEYRLHIHQLSPEVSFDLIAAVDGVLLREQTVFKSRVPMESADPWPCFILLQNA